MSALFSNSLKHKPPPFLRKKGKGGTRRAPLTTGMRPRDGNVRVVVVITYHQGDNNVGKFKWPATISEKQALHFVFEQLQHLDEICQIVFSQVANGTSRIPWLDEPPNGKYVVNQDYEFDSDEDDFVEEVEEDLEEDMDYQ